jgi:hypothetical protein
VQVAQFLEAAICHCARRFWSALPGTSGDEVILLPNEAQQALSDTSAAVADSICQAHPMVADTKATLSQKLARLPPALHPAACSRAALAHEGMLCLQLCDINDARTMPLARRCAALRDYPLQTCG